MRTVISLLLVISYLFISNLAFAVSVTASDIPSSITDQPFSFSVSVGGAQAGTNYLRANLFPSGTTNYFGYTNSGSSFYNGSDYSLYLPITIDSGGNWNGTVTAKVDTDSSYYHGPGTYSLKVRRYTSSGSSYTWSNEATLTIALPTSTPTPSPTPTNTPSPTQTPTPKPTATPKPSKDPTSTPSPSLAKSPTLTPTSGSTSSNATGSVVLSHTNDIPEDLLGTSSALTELTPSPDKEVEVASSKQINLPFIIIGMGGLFISAAVLYIRWKYF